LGWLLPLAAVAILLSFLAVYWLWSRARYSKVAVTVLLVFLGCVGYQAIYPPDSYYRVEFERIARVPLPSGGKTLLSNTTNSVYSSYRSCAVIAVSLGTSETYDKLSGDGKLKKSWAYPTTGLTKIERQHGAPIASRHRTGRRTLGVISSNGALLDDGKSVAYFTMRWRNFNPV